MAILNHNESTNVRKGGILIPVLWGLLILLLSIGWLGGTPAIAAPAPSPSEDQIKAAFVINFPKYVEWPASAFPTTNSPIVIATVGDGKVAAELRKMVEGRTVNGRPVTLIHAASDETLTAGCHILFIASEEQRQWPDLIARLQNASVLTVGESDDFLEKGGMINLARRDRKVALEVNLAATGKARLKISSKLLSVAEVVKGKQN